MKTEKEKGSEKGREKEWVNSCAGKNMKTKETLTIASRKSLHVS